MAEPSSSKPTATVEQQPPVLLEIRIGGRVKFRNEVYNPELISEDETLTLSAALHPTMISVQKRPPERFGEDPREGEDVILQVHSGRQEAAIEEAEKTPAKKAPAKKAATKKAEPKDES